MKKSFYTIVFLLLLQNLFSQESTYRNPVIACNFPDPTVIRVGETYYTAGTSEEWAPPYRVYESNDLVNWKYLGPLFKEMPEWTMGSYWAPELFYHNRTYYVYYTARRKSDRKSFVGVATTDDIHKGFTDHGLIIEWTNEAIDAFAIELDGKLYITWKAYGLDSDRIIQLLGAELSDDGLSVKGEAFTILEANIHDWEAGGMEGQCLVKHSDYIYMFYAGNSCCGINCNYMTGVARAKNIKGPWEKYSGNPILVGDEYWKCPGHGTLVTTPDNRYFFMYHAYNALSHIYTGRQGMLDEILWDEKTGWPYFRYGKTPSLQAETPYPGTIQKEIPDFYDDFSSGELKCEWIWTASQPKPEFSINNNQLKLKGNDSPVGSFLGLRAQKNEYRLSATVEATASPAGICLNGGRDGAIGLSLRDSNIELWKISDGNRLIISAKPFQLNKASLFLEVTSGQYCRFGYVNEAGASVYIGDPEYVLDRPSTPGIHSKGMNHGLFDSVEIRYNTAAGMYWPEGRAFPSFSTPADSLDAIQVESTSLTSEEVVMLTVLQGLVNKTKPSVLLLRQRANEGMYKWPQLLDLKLREYKVEDKWELVRKYRDRINGVILYSNEKSTHYSNLATTVAGLKNALPVTAAEYEKLSSLNMKFPVLEDLTDLPYTEPKDVYLYLYNTYWKDCTKRLLVHHRAQPYIRDIAVAAGAAVIWLDPRKDEEKKVIHLFLNDMKAGESIILGWWPEERSGIGSGTEHGISTVPADYYDNATVYAGMSPIINLPVIPKKPELENKIYLAIFLSDGDNVQYCQHAMSRLWDNPNRGIIPINWTISPGLADLGPGLLNYYYKTASQNDFFASGPSGLGYTLLYDAHNYKWNNTGGKEFDAYMKLTQRYLEKSGLRVITVWDQVNETQMDSYATYCRYMYGATQQDWERQKGKIPAYTKQNKLAFLPNYPCYANGPNVFVRMNRDTIAKFDGKRPVFLTAQGESWKMGPEAIVELQQRLDSISPGNIVVCRGDHFFALYNEANGMDFNLTLSSKMKITSNNTSVNADFAADGTCAAERTWISLPKGEKWIRFDFGKTYMINRYVIWHSAPEVNGMPESFRAKSFKVETSENGKKWKLADEQRNNTANVTDTDFSPVKARYVRINIADDGNPVGIADVEIYGTLK